MNRSILAACLITSHLGLCIACQARPIDDFSVGPFEVSLDSENQTGFLNQDDLPESVIAGGVRRVIASVDGTVAPGIGANVTVDTEGKTFAIATSPVSGIEGFLLEYGWGLGNELNLDLTAYSAFRIDVVSFSGPTFEAEFLFRSGGDATAIGAQFLTIAENSVPSSFLVPFAPFATPDRPRPLDTSDIDFIRLTGQLPPGSELVLGGIFAVPEPATIVLISSSLLVLAARRC